MFDRPGTFSWLQLTSGITLNLDSPYRRHDIASFEASLRVNICSKVLVNVLISAHALAVISSTWAWNLLRNISSVLLGMADWWLYNVSTALFSAYVTYECDHHWLGPLKWMYTWFPKPNIFITKTCLFKYTENFTIEKWKFSDKKFWYFSYFCSKHRMWVLVRTASVRRF